MSGAPYTRTCVCIWHGNRDHKYVEGQDLGDLTLALLSPLSLPPKNKKVIETNMHCATPRSSAVLIMQILNGLSLEHKILYCLVAVIHCKKRLPFFPSPAVS